MYIYIPGDRQTGENDGRAEKADQAPEGEAGEQDEDRDKGEEGKCSREK